jgi:hypothetical protein
MRISHKYKFVFLSNPKTGSESVRHLLDPYSDIKAEDKKTRPFRVHSTAVETRDIFRAKGWDFDAYYTFTFVRNPWARLVSAYEMIYGKHVAIHNPSLSKAFLRRLKFLKTQCIRILHHYEVPDFKHWLTTLVPYGRIAGGPRNSACSIEHFVMGANRKILVDKIIRLEDIQTDLMPTLQKIGLPLVKPLQIPQLNVMRHKHYTTYYDYISIELVRKLYAYDIEHFHYTFGE